MSDATINFLLTPDELKQTIAKTGFMELQGKDITTPSLERFRTLVASIATRTTAAPPPLGLNLLMGETTTVKAKNLARNLKEGRIEVVQGFFKRMS